MKAELIWDQGMHFNATSGENSISMDTHPPLGKGQGMTPKELVIAGLAGCTAMDVVALLKKHKQNQTSFKATIEVDKSEGGHPAVFTKALIQFWVEGEVDSKVLSESVLLSQTKYCGVSAMLSKAFPINYKVYLNQNLVSEGSAQF